jgi:hypothetical protein
MTLELKHPFSTYFEAQSVHDIDGMLACFSADASVHDEGRDLEGHREIRAWIEETTRKYRPTIRPISSAEEGARTIVTAQVSGSFPGSPIELRYRFNVSRKKIASLEIE